MLAVATVVAPMFDGAAFAEPPLESLPPPQAASVTAAATEMPAMSIRYMRDLLE
jgi:hypothetical protein